MHVRVHMCEMPDYMLAFNDGCCSMIYLHGVGGAVFIRHTYTLKCETICCSVNLMKDVAVSSLFVSQLSLSVVVHSQLCCASSVIHVWVL